MVDEQLFVRGKSRDRRKNRKRKQHPGSPVLKIREVDSVIGGRADLPVRIFHSRIAVTRAEIEDSAEVDRKPPFPVGRMAGGRAVGIPRFPGCKILHCGDKLSPANRVIENGVLLAGMVFEHRALLKVPSGGFCKRREHPIFKISQFRHVLRLRQAVGKLYPMAQVPPAPVVRPHIVVAEEVLRAVLGRQKAVLHRAGCDQVLRHGFISPFPFVSDSARANSG